VKKSTALNHFAPARTDEAHGPGHYVEQLRQFVQAEGAQEPADTGDAQIRA